MPPVRLPSLLAFAALFLLYPHAGRAQAPAAAVNCDSLSPPRVWPDSAQAFIWTLPRIRCLAHARASARLDSESTTQAMVEAIDQIRVGLQPRLLQLTSFYPQRHFGRDPTAYVDSVFRTRGRWLWLVSQPDGVGSAGTIHRIDMALTGVSILEGMIEEAARGLASRDDSFPWELWQSRWRRRFDLGAASN